MFDPAAYAPFYMPMSLGMLGIEQRFSFLHNMHRSPYRDKTIFLDIEPEVAVRRIDERIAHETSTCLNLTRPKWRHQHENVSDLREIRGEFIKVLVCLENNHRTEVSTIDVTCLNKDLVGKKLAQEMGM